jgi:hypothetical protein
MRRQVTTIITVAGLALGPATVSAGAVPARDPAAAVVAAKAAQVPIRVTAGQQSPDARDANLAAQQSAVTSSIADPRSPDARDAGTGVRVPDVTVTPVAVTSADRGFGWGDAGIGAGVILAIALLGLGLAAGAQHRRHQPGHLAH